MRETSTPFPTLEKTCAGIAASASRARAVSAAAIGAIAAYRIDQREVAGIVSCIAPAVARDGGAE
jgi:hypothetical protein